MTSLTCRADGCDGITTDGTGWCPGHRRALTFTAKLTDAVREFLHKSLGDTLASSVVVTPKNRDNIELAGTYLAQGMALLVSTCFGSAIDYNPAPITLRTKSNSAAVDWRTDFKWVATETTQLIDDDLDEFDDEEFEDEEFEDDP